MEFRNYELLSYGSQLNHVYWAPYDYVAFSTFRMEKMTSIQGRQLPIRLTEYIAAGVKSRMVLLAGSAACMNEMFTQDPDPKI
jgi:hypothetical protein